MYHTLARQQFDNFLSALRQQGYQVLGPRLQDAAIVYQPVQIAAELPVGMIDQQAPGKYSLRQYQEPRLFAYTLGPHSWKKFLFPPEQTLLKINNSDGQISFEQPDLPDQRYAFLGVRACEIKAMQVQDLVFLRGSSIDRHYKNLRDNAFIIALNCSFAADTCFCTSLGSGPCVESGFDLALTEVFEEANHFFVLQAGSDRGRAIIDLLQLRASSPQELHSARRETQNAISQIESHPQVNMKDLPELLLDNYEHPHWDKIAERCLSCGNCTMVCPTCFCSDVEDINDLSGQESQRVRKWDSCYSLDFSYIHGGSVRQSIKSRYRQWLTHKLATWIEQFGSSGCVGCGRCISWCPTGIDLRLEISAFRESPGGKP